MFPTMETYITRDLFLYCSTYTCTIPQISQSEQNFNCFEKSVLSLIMLSIYEPQELSNTLCLKQDFVKMLLLGLQEKTAIDQNNHITEHGTELFAEDLNNCSTTDERTITIYKHGPSNIMLPFIQTQKHAQTDNFTQDSSEYETDDFEFLPNPHNPKSKSKQIEVHYGSKGENQTIKGNVIPYKNDEHCLPPTCAELKEHLIKFFQLASEKSGSSNHAQITLLDQCNFEDLQINELSHEIVHI